jgi:hypothetical protein
MCRHHSNPVGAVVLGSKSEQDTLRALESSQYIRKQLKKCVLILKQVLFEIRARMQYCFRALRLLACAFRDVHHAFTGEDAKSMQVRIPVASFTTL